MATLKCKSCEGNISSNARRVQCPHCGELFPFVCARCDHKLRPAFAVFDDERYLTLDAQPKPLCDEHYLRKCPDCDQWFGADENPGFFRCTRCLQNHNNKAAAQSAPETLASEAFPARPAPASGGGVATSPPAKSAGGNSNALVIGFAVCAFLALVAWMVFGR